MVSKYLLAEFFHYVIDIHDCLKIYLVSHSARTKGLVNTYLSYPKAPFSIATTLGCRGGRYSIHWIAPLYP